MSLLSLYHNFQCWLNPISLSAIANIGWRVFIIFAIFNALWVPLVYAFFPETKGLELEDVDHIFDKGGITGGVWSSPGGRTVERKRIDQDIETETKEIQEDDSKQEWWVLYDIAS